MTALVNCIVSLGMFSTERAVEIASTPEPFVGFINESFVVAPPLSGNEKVDGKVEAYYIDQEGNMVLIDVPSDPRQRIWVDNRLVEKRG